MIAFCVTAAYTPPTEVPMPAWGGQLIAQMAPIIFSMLAPIITGLIEALGERLGVPVPKPALPVVNGAAGIGIASLVAAGSPMSPLAVPFGLIGSQFGNRVREAINKGKTKPA